jgi:hypothetical protein
MPLTHIKNHKPAKLPTPINLEQLSFLLKSYDSDLKTFLLSGFTLGFHLGSDFNKSSAMQCKNHKSALYNQVIVAEKIRKEIDKDRYKGPFEHPPFSKFTCSPLGLIPKKKRKVNSDLFMTCIIPRVILSTLLYQQNTLRYHMKILKQ